MNSGSSIMSDQSMVIAEILIALQILWLKGSMLILMRDSTKRIYTDLLPIRCKFGKFTYLKIVKLDYPS